LDCLDHHYDHDPKKNVTKHTEASIKQKIQEIIDQVKPKNKDQTEFIQELHEIIHHQKKANK
jgi:L-rhamnose mutarotase